MDQRVSERDTAPAKEILGFSASAEEQKVATFSGFGKHGVQPVSDHDECARSDFMMELYRHLGHNMAPGRKDIYEARVKPAFVKEHGRAPKDRHEVRKAVKDDPYFQFWGHLRVYCNQVLFYENGRTVDRQLDDLIALAKPRTGAKGKLELDPDFKIPKYQAPFDMHWMPGSYFTELAEDDVAAGAMYDSGGLYVMTSGHLGPYGDGGAYSVINYLRERFPDFAPTSILDQGCTVGHNTLPFKEAWPDADVTGIDIGASVLRYAHARSEDMGYDVAYSQQNAEHTKFEDESFDFITSTMFLHETSYKAVHDIVREGFRLLKPGGLMLHVEQPPFRWFDEPFDQFVRDWDTHNNNEPFWGPMHDMDLEEVAALGGFARQNVVQEMAQLIKPTETDRYAKADGQWYVFAAWKH
jgi:ubiquinone/menaquinone biosynthesis C-methylase UbiE